MRIVTTTYPVYNLWIQRPFEIEGYAFTPVGGMEGYQERLREMLATSDNVHTVDVVRTAQEGDATVQAYLWDSGELIEDLMVLLSLAQGRSVHYQNAPWVTRDGDAIVAQGAHRQYFGRAVLRGEQAISPFEIDSYLESALKYIHHPGWVVDRGFGTAAQWYLESLSVASHELRFVCVWHGMSALVQRYFHGHWEGTGEEDNMSMLFLAFRDAHEYDFILDQHPPIWLEISKDLLGRHPSRRVFPSRQVFIYTRKLQIVLLLSLLDLVGYGDFARRENLLRDVRR